MWAVGSTKVQDQIESCLRDAVRKTLKDMESLLPLARRGRNGTQQIHAELAAAMFLHTTSRDLDPQLHIHSVIPNLCYGSDGRWGSVNSRMLHTWTPALGRVFRCHLGKALIERMNVELERPVREDGKLESWFEVKGVSKKAIREFSQRRQAIEKATPRKKLADSHARAKANRETRRRKEPHANLKTLREQWRERGKKLGLTGKKVEQITDQSAERKPLTQKHLLNVFDEAIYSVGEEKAHFREWNVVSEVCQAVQHRGVDAGTVVPQLLDHLRHSQATIQLDTKPSQAEYSTRENWDRETQLLNDVSELSHQQGAQVSANTIRRTLDRFQRNRKKPFSAEQRKAAEDLLSDRSSIRLLTGVAGAGKSVTLDAVRAGLKRDGYQVIGGALAGKAAEGLREKTDMPTRTVASYLYHLEKRLPKRMADRVQFDARMMIRALRGKRTYKHEPVKIPHKGVLIIDEAGMLDTRTLSRLVHHVKKAKATLILVGDSHQLPPIQAGGPLDAIAKKTGNARLATNHRQLDPSDAKAAAAVRSGRVKEAIDTRQ
jgi:nucleoside-triphosphatase THEP1